MKDARLNLAVTDELKNKLELLAEMQDAKSLSAFVQRVLTEYVELYCDELKAYSTLKAQLDAIKKSRKFFSK